MRNLARELKRQPDAGTESLTKIDKVLLASTVTEGRGFPVRLLEPAADAPERGGPRAARHQYRDPPGRSGHGSRPGAWRVARCCQSVTTAGRDDGHGPAIASLTFFVLLLMAFALQLLMAPGQFYVPAGLAFIPGVLFGGAQPPSGVVFPPPATLVTYQFLHGGWLHLAGNLLFLWVFGPKVERTLGSGCWTTLLLLSGVAAALTQAWPDPSSPVAMIGASGGISGILGAYLYLHPRAEIRTVIPVVHRASRRAASGLGGSHRVVCRAVALHQPDGRIIRRCRVSCSRRRVCVRFAAGAGATLLRVVVCGCAPRCPNSRGAGIRVIESPAGEEPIPLRRETVTAFVGPAPRGPANIPVIIESVAEFRRRFGSPAERSRLEWILGQFFDNGGRSAIVVRVPRSGAANRITLPGPGGTLDLEAVNPGPLEYLRAAVDYDGIPAADLWRFNLTVQRIRSRANPLVEEQEAWRAVTVVPDEEGYIGDVLAGSGLVRLHGEPPRARPYVTPGAAGIGPVGYVHGRGDWRSAAPPSDYDLIGSAEDSTGIHALEQVANVDLVCLLSGAPKADVGPVGIFAAERYCARRNAILLLDPPAHWSQVEDVARSQRESVFASPNVITYFPQLTELSADGKRVRTLSALGAIAGMLASQGPSDCDAAAFEGAGGHRARCRRSGHAGSPRRECVARGRTRLHLVQRRRHAGAPARDASRVAAVERAPAGRDDREHDCPQHALGGRTETGCGDLGCGRRRRWVATCRNRLPPASWPAMPVSAPSM